MRLRAAGGALQGRAQQRGFRAGGGVGTGCRRNGIAGAGERSRRGFLRRAVVAQRRRIGQRRRGRNRTRRGGGSADRHAGIDQVADLDIIGPGGLRGADGQRQRGGCQPCPAYLLAARAALALALGSGEFTGDHPRIEGGVPHQTIHLVHHDSWESRIRWHSPRPVRVHSQRTGSTRVSGASLGLRRERLEQQLPPARRCPTSTRFRKNAPAARAERAGGCRDLQDTRRARQSRARSAQARRYAP